MRVPSKKTHVSLLTAFLTLGLGPSSPVSAQQLGRLFTTPEQRSELNRLRAEFDPNMKVEEAKPAPDLVFTAPRPSVNQVTVNGILFRSDGQDMSWVNGVAIRRGEVTREGLRVLPKNRTGGGVRIELPNDYFKPIDLKPGQKVDIVQGKILDAYETRSHYRTPASLFERSEKPAVDSAPETSMPESARAPLGEQTGEEATTEIRVIPRFSRRGNSQ